MATPGVTTPSATPSKAQTAARLSALNAQMQSEHKGAGGGGKEGGGKAQEGLVQLDKELAESELPQELLLAAMNAQLLETMSALAQRETEVRCASPDARLGSSLGPSPAAFGATLARAAA